MFNPSRLELARKRRGMIKTQLASLVDVELRTITAYCSGKFAPSEETLTKLTGALSFPRDFFFGDNLEEPAEGGVSFRSMSRMSAAKRDAALAAGAIAFALNDWIEERFNLPQPDLLSLAGENPETAARMLRQHWKFGELPVRNMIHLLEAKGVRVFSLVENAVEVDAFSLWRENTPYVFLNTMKSAEHSRFDAAHELGHLVLHKHGGPKGQGAEREANQFASAFLMPRASVLASAPRFPTLTHLVYLKKQWIVSVAALAYRLNQLDLLSDWHYRMICIEMSKLGYWKSEPLGARHETSQVWAKVFSTLRSEGVTKNDIASDLSVHVDEIDKLIFCLVMTAIEGGHPAPGAKKPAALRVVK